MIQEKTTDLSLSLNDVYPEEDKHIDQREEKCGAIISLLKGIDDFKCLPKQETPIYDNLFQALSAPIPITCVPSGDTLYIEMLPTYKKVVITGKVNFQCRFIDCYFVSNELSHLMEHQRVDHGVYECNQCSTLYFSKTERDNCVSIHESEEVAKSAIIIDEFRDSISNGPTKGIGVEKPFLNSRRLSLSIARSQAQLVAYRHLAIIATRNGNDMLVTSKQKCEDRD